MFNTQWTSEDVAGWARRHGHYHGAAVSIRAWFRGKRWVLSLRFQVIARDAAPQYRSVIPRWRRP